MDYKKEIINCQEEITGIKDWINSGKNKFDPITQHLIRYSIIRISGNIEYVFKDIIFKYITEVENIRSYSFLFRKIKKNSCNPSCGNIKNLLFSIHKELGESFEKIIKSDPQNSIAKGSLTSLVNLRNAIAHGEIDLPTTCTIEQIIDYYQKSGAIIDILVAVLEKTVINNPDIDNEDDTD